MGVVSRLSDQKGFDLIGGAVERMMQMPVQLVVQGVLLLAVVALTLAGRARSRRDLALAQAETSRLQARLDALEARLEATSAQLVESRDPAYVITDAGAERPEPTVPDRVVLSATVGEPLVRVMALGHGVVRALSPESRNRIWFEVRREVRRSRRQRRRADREVLRQARAEQRAA